MANLRVDKITSTETFETTGSVQFDASSGTGLVVGSSDCDFGTGDFTIEGWFLVQDSAAIRTIFDSRTSDNQSTGLFLGINTDDTLYTYGFPSGTGVVSYETPEPNIWHHVAVARNGSDGLVFLDGKLVSSGVKMGSSDYTQEGGTIGQPATSFAAGLYRFKGHISNVRVVKGKALYTTDFKPPMRELEVTPETVLLACQSKTDASLEKTGKTITVNGTAVASELTPGILTPVPKAGGGSAITGSVEFTGSPSRLIADSVDFAIGSNDLTMECWFYNGVDTITHLLQIDTGTYQSPSDITNFSLATRDAAAGDVRFLVRNDSGSNLSDLIDGAPRAKINAWHHLAGTIEGTTTRLFLNGVLIKSGTISGTRTHTGQRCTIGSNQTSRYLKGYISNARIVKGTALYTKDFIPPTRELKKVPGTVLLACQDPDSPFTEATGKTLNGFGDHQRSNGREYITNGSFIGGYTTEWEAKNSASISHTAASNTVSVTSTQNYSGIKVKSAYLPTLTVGKTYAMTIDLVSLTNPIRFGVVSGNNLTVSTAGKHTLLFTGTASTTEIFIEKPTGSNSTFVLNSVSLKEVDGTHPSSNFTPQVGDDRKVTFEGVTRMNSDAYFYLPTGDTVTRDSRSGRGLLMGGYTTVPSAAAINTIEFITISSLGNAQVFGDLTSARFGGGGCGSSTRGLYGGGEPSKTPIDYVTIASTGNSISFGSLVSGSGYVKACSNQTRGIWGGGRNPNSASIDVVQYITIASTGNSVDFGNLTSARTGIAGFASPIRGIFSGGYTHPSPTTIATLDYITIAATGNALDFGDLLTNVKYSDAVSSGTRGAIGGGGNPNTNVIQYVTISTLGNAQDFGDLIVAREHISGTDNSIRGVFMGGITPTSINNLDYVTIASTGNASDFGDLSQTIGYAGGTSDSHGGLG
jgi:hypothetical protein